MRYKMEKVRMFHGRNDWYDIWAADKDSLIQTMVRNMADDLEAGYDYFGACITRQRAEIEEYKAKYFAELDQFVDWDDNKVNRWCYTDMVKRGAIEAF